MRFEPLAIVLTHSVGGRSDWPADTTSFWFLFQSVPKLLVGIYQSLTRYIYMHGDENKHSVRRYIKCV